MEIQVVVISTWVCLLLIAPLGLYAQIGCMRTAEDYFRRKRIAQEYSQHSININQEVTRFSLSYNMGMDRSLGYERIIY